VQFATSGKRQRLSLSNRYASARKTSRVVAKADPKGTHMRQAFTATLWRIPLTCVVAATLAACDPAGQAQPDVSPEPGVFTPTRNGPENAPQGTCWGKTVSPAVIESVSERVLETPAEVSINGTIRRPPVYRTEDRQVIVTARRNNWFETPCPDVLTVEFVSTLQRALQARGTYGGAVTGQMDDATRDAVLTVQRANGLDSAVLSLETARSLGLIAVARATLD
jgi:hypothetical protein